MDDGFSAPYAFYFLDDFFMKIAAAARRSAKEEIPALQPPEEPSEPEPPGFFSSVSSVAALVTRPVKISRNFVRPSSVSIFTLVKLLPFTAFARLSNKTTPSTSPSGPDFKLVERSPPEGESVFVPLSPQGPVQTP